VSGKFSIAFLSIPVLHYPAQNPDSVRCIQFLFFIMAEAIILLTELNRSIRRKPAPSATLSTEIFKWTDCNVTGGSDIIHRRLTAWAMSRPL